MVVLLSSIEDHDRFGRHMAIKAAFARESSAAFDYFDERFGITHGKHWMLIDVLYFLLRGAITSPRVPIGSTLEDRLNDPRWVNACARHRRHPELGHAAAGATSRCSTSRSNSKFPLGSAVDRLSRRRNCRPGAVYLRR